VMTALSAWGAISLVLASAGVFLLGAYLLVREVSRFANRQLKPELDEAGVVATQVSAALQPPGSQPLEATKVGQWVTYQFRKPLERLLKQARTDTVSHRATNLVIIAGGFATSGLAVAAGENPGTAVRWVVFSVGLIVALAGGVAQTFRLGPRAGGRQALAAELRGEGWALVHKHGRYRETAPPDPARETPAPNTGAAKAPTAFERFDAQVSDIHRRAREIATPEGPTMDQSPSDPAEG
jgi:hypothetical protein